MGSLLRLWTALALPGPARHTADAGLVRVPDQSQPGVVPAVIWRRHTPIRPLWLCRVDAHPWPCGTARLALIYRYGHDPAALGVNMCRMLYAAAHDLHRLDPDAVPSPADLYARFIAWTSHAGEPRST